MFAAGAKLPGLRIFGQAAAAAQLIIDTSKPWKRIAPDFTGLSYESAQLSDPQFFSGDNAQLIGLVRRLGKTGVLRIGGNTSEYCFWKSDPQQGASAAQPTAGAPMGPDPGHKVPPRRVIQPQAVRNLREFLDATGWSLIYGLNMGLGTPAAAADEAASVIDTIGDRLIVFQLCNEPDLFYKNGIRPAGYNYAQFAVEWQRFFQAIRARVPKASFAGPDTAFNNEWLAPFARQFKEDVRFVSQHYYAEGPPSDPSMTLDRLLHPDPKLEREFAGMRQMTADTGLPFRLAETNSCYAAGKQGVSDTFGAALWGADLMYRLAQAGGEGINFHGGGYGWYTPIAGTRENGFLARPLYYGMLLFAQAGGGQLLESTLATLGGHPVTEQLRAYALRAEDGRRKVQVLNLSATEDVRLSIAAGPNSGRATVLRLTGRLNDTTDVTLGASVVGDAGAWTPEPPQTIQLSQGSVAVDIPAASAALVTFLG